MQGVNSMKVSIKVETWYKQILTSFFFFIENGNEEKK